MTLYYSWSSNSFDSDEQVAFCIIWQCALLLFISLVTHLPVQARTPQSVCDCSSQIEHFNSARPKIAAAALNPHFQLYNLLIYTHTYTQRRSTVSVQLPGTLYQALCSLNWTLAVSKKNSKHFFLRVHNNVFLLLSSLNYVMSAGLLFV